MFTAPISVQLFLVTLWLSVRQLIYTDILVDVNADLLKKPLCLQVRSLLSVMKQLQLVDPVHVPTRVTVSSSSQTDMLMTTNVQCFDSTGLYPFSGSDHHLIVSNFYASGMCVDSVPHHFFVRNFQKLDTDNFDELLMCDDIWGDVLSGFDNLSDCLECFNQDSR